MEKEFTEFTNSWWDDANRPDKRRWLLIGDSVHRDYRHPLQNICKPIQVSIDFYATSFHIEEDSFRREIEHYLSFREYFHELIFVSWGGHHGYARRTCDDESIKKAYVTAYEKLLRYVMAHCQQIVIVASTPVTQKGKPDVLNEVLNQEVESRNQIAMVLARKYHLPYVDHYRFVMNHLDTIKFRDHKHFINPQGSRMLAQVLYNALEEAGILLSDGSLSKQVSPRINTPGLAQFNVISQGVWAHCSHNAVMEATWLRKKGIYVGVGQTEEVGWNFLYPLLRLLEEYSPKDILEFDFGQSTKVTLQYASAHQASHTVLVHDRDRIEHFLRCWGIPFDRTSINGSSLLQAEWNGWTGVLYHGFDERTKGNHYDLILLKCPFGGGIRIHMDPLMKLPEILAKDFAILMDHVEDGCGQAVFRGIMVLLQEKGIPFLWKCFPSEGRVVGLLSSVGWKYAIEI